MEKVIFTKCWGGLENIVLKKKQRINRDYNHFSTNWKWKDSGREKEWTKWEKTALYLNSLLPDGSHDYKLIWEGRVENICWALWATRGDPHTSKPREWQLPLNTHSSSFLLLRSKAGPSAPILHFLTLTQPLCFSPSIFHTLEHAEKLKQNTAP